MIVVFQNSQSARSAEAKMSDQNRFCLGNRTSCNSIKQYPLQSGCIRNVHYPLKSGIFVQSVEKNRTESDNSDRFLVEVTGFEPATFWSRRPFSGKRPHKIQAACINSHFARRESPPNARLFAYFEFPPDFPPIHSPNVAALYYLRSV